MGVCERATEIVSVPDHCLFINLTQNKVEEKHRRPQKIHHRPNEKLRKAIKTFLNNKTSGYLIMFCL